MPTQNIYSLFKGAKQRIEDLIQFCACIASSLEM